jgi:hypothetical protein
MKALRKWSRILHRDIGYFFIGTTLIYALSGIALNHMHDWNANYVVSVDEFKTSISLNNTSEITNHIKHLITDVAKGEIYKKHYYPEPDLIKIFLKGGSSIVVDLNSGLGRAEYLKRRPVFYEVNYLHYNPNNWWKWFSDVFAVALILFAVTSFFMVKGKKGIRGTGGIYTVLGFIVPLLFLWFFLK